MDKSTYIPGGKEYKADAIPAKEMQTEAELLLQKKMEEAFDKLKKNPELLATMKRMKDK